MKTYLKIFVATMLTSVFITVNAQTVPALSTDSKSGNTYYFSTAGNNNNDGLSEVKPKQFVTGDFISGLKPGDMALFKRGDKWHDDAITWDFSNIRGSAESTIYFGAYGTGEAPVIAKLRLVTDTWQGDGSGVWSVPWAITQAKTYMLYIDDKIVAPALHSGSVATMANETFFVTGGRLYLKGFGNPTGRQVEVNTSAGGNFIVFNNSEYITFEAITFKGTSQRSTFINGIAPTRNLVFRNLTIKHIGGYLTVFISNGPANHIDHLWEDNVIDRTWGPTVYRAMRNNGPENSSIITTDAICYRNAGERIVVRSNTFINWGHTTVNLQQIKPATDSPQIRFNIIERNLFIQGDSEYNRAFEFCGDDRVNNNIFRYNYVYGHTNSSHFLGVDNIVYCNIFDTIVLTRADTKTVQPQHIDLGPWVGDGVTYVSLRNVIINNTFVGGRENLVVGYSTEVGNNLIANNIFYSWWGNHAITIGGKTAPQTVLNNVFWNSPNNVAETVISQANNLLTVTQVNDLPTMSGNIAGDPRFRKITSGYEAGNFSLQTTSPCLNAGIALSSISSSDFPIIDVLKKPGGYQDLYGNPFDNNEPTVGAISAKEVSITENPDWPARYTSSNWDRGNMSWRYSGSDGLKMPFRPFDRRTVYQNPPDFSWPQIYNIFYDMAVGGQNEDYRYPYYAERYELIICRDEAMQDVAYHQGLKGIYAGKAYDDPPLTDNFYNFPVPFETGGYYWSVRFIGYERNPQTLKLVTNKEVVSKWTAPRRFRIDPDAWKFPLLSIEEQMKNVKSLGHPRIWTNTDDLERFSNAAKTGFQKMTFDGLPNKLTVHYASVYTNGAIPVSEAQTTLGFPPEPKRGMKEQGGTEITGGTDEDWMQFRSRCGQWVTRMLEAAFYHLVTGDETAARFAVDMMLAMSEWRWLEGDLVYTIAKGSSGDQIHRDIVYKSAMAYDWVWNYLDNAIKITGKIEKGEAKPEEGIRSAFKDQRQREINAGRYPGIPADASYKVDKPYYTVADRQKILDAIRGRAEVIARSSFGRLNRSPFDSHGWTAFGYLGIISVATLGELTDEKGVDKAEEWLWQIVPLYTNLLPPWSNEDGSWAQGTDYYQYSSNSNFEFMNILLSAKMVNLFDKAWARNQGNYDLYMHPHSSLGAYGDAAYREPNHYGVDRMGRIASVYKNEQYQWYWQPMAGNNPLINQGSTGAYSHYLWSRDYTVKATPPSGYPNARYFPDTGLVGMHSDISDNNRISMFFKSSPYGSYNHSHPDQNSFIINAFGQHLAIDAGYYDLYHSLFDVGFTRRTYAHNTITYGTNYLDKNNNGGGNGQWVTAGATYNPRTDKLFDDINAKGKITGFVHHSDFDAATGDASTAYKFPEVSKAVRHIVYLRPDMFITIDDLASGSGDRTFEWWMNAYANNTGTITSSLNLYNDEKGLKIERSTSTGAAALDVRIHFPTTGKFTKITGFAGIGKDATQITASLFDVRVPVDRSDTLPMPARGTAQQRAYFQTTAAGATKIIATLDVHRITDTARDIEVKEHLGTNAKNNAHLAMQLKDGSLVIVPTEVNIPLRNTFTIDGWSLDPSAAALVEKNGSILFVAGKELIKYDSANKNYKPFAANPKKFMPEKVANKLIIQSDMTVTVAMGKGELAISAMDDGTVKIRAMDIMGNSEPVTLVREPVQKPVYDDAHLVKEPYSFTEPYTDAITRVSYRDFPKFRVIPQTGASDKQFGISWAYTEDGYITFNVLQGEYKLYLNNTPIPGEDK